MKGLSADAHPLLARRLPCGSELREHCSVTDGLPAKETGFNVVLYTQDFPTIGPYEVYRA